MQINKAAEEKKVVFIIPGYSAHPTGENGGTSMVSEKMRKILTDNLRLGNLQFVEIYWNGLSKETARNNKVSKSLNSFKVWENAQASAGFAALELRRILKGLNAKDIFLINHSHGAAVATNALFPTFCFQSQV